LSVPLSLPGFARRHGRVVRRETFPVAAVLL